MKILMVCLGNICRSPLAEGIARQKIAIKNLSIQVDSAGTSGIHAGNPPDERMCETAKSFGLFIDDLRSRQFVVADFDQFDLIFAMDKSNYNNILKLARSEKDRSKVRLLLNELEPNKNLEVPDPYYGGKQGFIEVYKLLDTAIEQLLQNLN